MSYNLRPKELSEPIELLEEMKKNPLALELLHTLNEQKINEGKQPIKVTIWSGLDYDGRCFPKRGEIHVNNKLKYWDKLLTLIFELCNVAQFISSNLYLADRRYPIQRENYIRAIEKNEYLSGKRTLKIYSYGVENLGWDPKHLKKNTKFFQQPFEQYYQKLHTYDEGKMHCEHYGSIWDNFYNEHIDTFNDS